ncbi:metallophosphoesterase [Cryptosporangium arvum]|uniref:metallophosphoesterase n=1 Tax=Cryptosporangium arvum TaxID=80871 RepID=UPI0004B172A0|nr:metallophosphoesterase [Cryptosporangium arvum]
MTVIAHVSDLHLDGGPRAAGRAGAVFDYLDRCSVDAILVTGDIADHGAPAEYEEAAKLFADRDNLFTCPGNHDRRRPYRTVLLGDPTGGDEPVNRLHRLGADGPAFLLCDSSIPGRHDGMLAEETLAWIRTSLTTLPPDVPAFVVFHHPPVVLHQPYIDEIRLADADSLALVLGDFPQVVAVLTGHAHTAAASTFAGLPLLVGPGVVSTLLLPWEGDRIVDLDAPPALAFHVWDDGRLTTHYPGNRLGRRPRLRLCCPMSLPSVT